MAVYTNEMPEQPMQPSFDTTAEQNRERAFRNAARHSRFVKALRVMLPATCLGLMSLYFITSEVSVTIDGQTATVDAVELDSDKLKMVNPRLEGFSEKNGAYVITADAAYQNIANPENIELEKVVANVKNDQRGDAVLTANKGLFLSKKEFLRLAGDIRIKSNNGMAATLAMADIDMKKQTIKSFKPVTIEMNGSTINAKEMIIHTQEKQVDFFRDIVVKIKQQPKTGDEANTQKPKPTSPQRGLGSLAMNRSEPIDVTSNHLTVFDEKKIARFIGNVEAVQGTYKMTSAEMDVFYKGDADAMSPNNSGSADIDKIEARNNVNVVAPQGRSATANQMTFNTRAETISMLGNVVLVQGKNTLKGNQLFSDLKSGTSTFKPGGRVHGHFVNENQAARKKKQKPSTPPPAKSDPTKLDFSQAQGEPIDIDANTMTLNDVKRTVTFSGNVVTKQGGYTIKSETLTAFYLGSARSAPSSNSAANVDKIEAKRNVIITTPDNQSAKADWAKYDVKSEKIIVGGNVSLIRGDDVLKGERLVVDLKTGKSHIEQSADAAIPGKQKRVRALFMPRKNKKTTPTIQNNWAPQEN